MNYVLAEITHVEFDQSMPFEPKIRLFQNDDLKDLINLKNHKDPYAVFVQVTSAWMKEKHKKDV